MLKTSQLKKYFDIARVAVKRYFRRMTERLQIARGLINRPGSLFLDEPMRELDGSISRQLSKRVRSRAF
ncbi:MAG: hypothetical protein ABF683_13070 [Sporolactobacillus sp.]